MNNILHFHFITSQTKQNATLIQSNLIHKLEPVCTPKGKWQKNTPDAKLVLSQNKNQVS